MSQTVHERNPFMLMMNPEVVIAAMEQSERLRQLDRHLCRPLDRVSGPAGSAAAGDDADNDNDNDNDSDGEAESAHAVVSD